MDENDNKESDNPAPFLIRASGMKDKILTLAEDTVSALGFIFVEAKLSGPTLKVVIHRKNADVSMDDCAKLSNVLLRRLEVEIPQFSEKYALIVESPGADRKISTLRELGIFQDREMLFTLKNPGQSGFKDGVLLGRVTEISGTSLKILSDSGTIALEWDDISGVKLYFNIKNYL